MKVLWQCYSHISPLQQLEFSEKGEDMGEKFSIERKTNKVLSFIPDPLGSKNIAIHYPGAIFGSFLEF